MRYHADGHASQLLLCSHTDISSTNEYLCIEVKRVNYVVILPQPVIDHQELPDNTAPTMSRWFMGADARR